MADVTVLLTCAGQRVDIVRAFREALDGTGHDGRVLVSDLDPLSPSLFAADGAVELPPVSDPAYGAAVADACRREGVRAVLPLTDLDPVLLARAAPAIEEAGARVFLPSPEVALGCQDKWECHLMLERRGLPSPPTWLPDDADPAALPYPVLVKPRLGFAARHIYRCADPERARVLPALHAGRERHPAGPAGRGVQHRLPRRPRRPPPRGGAAQDDPGQGRRADQGRDPRRPPAHRARRGDGRVARPRRAQHRPVLPRGTGDPRHHRHQHPLRGAFPLPQAAGAAYPETIIAIAAGERPPARVGAHVAGVVMTRFLDQTILRREPRGLAPLTRVH